MSKPNDAEARVREALQRLEAAVEDLTATAKDRAADSLERVADRLQEAISRTQRGEGDSADARRGHGHSSRYREPLREPAWLWSDKPRTRTLYRDVETGKIFGVCAGIANYYGMESWVVRCLAVTALIFLNWMALAAYLIAALILARAPPSDSIHRDDGWDGSTTAGRPDRASRRRARRGRQSGSDARHDARRGPWSRPAPSAHRRLRTVRADFDEVELRLRRMETHVTSDRYELQRELAKIDRT